MTALVEDQILALRLALAREDGRRPGDPLVASILDAAVERASAAVEVNSCRDCPVGKQAPFNLCGIVGALRTTPAEVNADMPPSDCPLRGGPVTLRLVDRRRP